MIKSNIIKQKTALSICVVFMAIKGVLGDGTPSLQPGSRLVGQLATNQQLIKQSHSQSSQREKAAAEQAAGQTSPPTCRQSISLPTGRPPRTPVLHCAIAASQRLKVSQPTSPNEPAGPNLIIALALITDHGELSAEYSGSDLCTAAL